MWKARAFSILCVAVLALGIGAGAAAFSIVEGALLRPLPYRDPGRLVDIVDESRRESRLSKLFASAADFAEYRQHSRSFEQLATATWAYRPTIPPVSPSFFATLGVAPEVGRDFNAGDARGCAVMLSRSAWTEFFGQDPGIASRSIALDRDACTVAGVMPAPS